MKHTVSVVYKALGDTVQVSTDFEPGTGAQAIEMNQPLAASGTPLSVALAFYSDKVQSIVLLSDVNATVDFKSAADASVGGATLAANKPFLWHTDLNPVVDAADVWSDNVATISVTNTSNPLATGTLKIRLITDPS